jgi:hypothetical protein
VGSTQNQAQRKAEQAIRDVLMQQVHDQRCGGEREHDENSLPAGSGAEEAERCAAIEHQHQIEERRYL